MATAGRPVLFAGKVSCQVVTLRGELDLATAPALTAALQRAGAHPGSQVRVDLQAITFMDCAGVRPLVQARDDLLGRLCLWNPSPAATLLLELTGLLDTFVVITDSVAEAERGLLPNSIDPALVIPSSRPPVADRATPRPLGPTRPLSPRRSPLRKTRRWWPGPRPQSTPGAISM
jgi:anti-anti-sigma factor